MKLRWAEPPPPKTKPETHPVTVRQYVPTPEDELVASQHGATFHPRPFKLPPGAARRTINPDVEQTVGFLSAYPGRWALLENFPESSLPLLRRRGITVKVIDDGTVYVKG